MKNSYWVEWRVCREKCLKYNKKTALADGKIYFQIIKTVDFYKTN